MFSRVSLLTRMKVSRTSWVLATWKSGPTAQLCQVPAGPWPPSSPALIRHQPECRSKGRSCHQWPQRVRVDFGFMLPSTVVLTDTSVLTEGRDRAFGFIQGMEDIPPSLAPGPVSAKLHIYSFSVPKASPRLWPSVPGLRF